MASSCPSANQLRGLFDGCLPEEQAVRLGAHVDECPVCLDALQHMTSEVVDLAHCARNGRVKTMTVEPALREAMELLKESPLATAEFPDDEEEDFADTLLRPADKPGILGLLGYYEIVELIGTGGMGRVYKAMDPTLNRFVAIKLIAPQLSTSKGARKRFAREARAAAAISHENVVQIYSVPEVDGIPYLVMEYVPGISLQQKSDSREPIELKEILRIGQQTAAGLAAAHAQGLIHRDIKPPNILLEHGKDRVKITDFGLARMVDDASLTQSGVLAGTPQYMAPEQARGEAQDHRVDLFSLGSVLYTLCTGRPPFRANTTMAVLRQVSDQDAQPIRELNPRIPTWLCAIIAKLHEKDPDDRYQTAKGVAELLGQCLAHVEDPVRFPLPEWRDKRSILARRVLKPTSRAAILGFMVALVSAVTFWQAWQAISWANRPKVDPIDSQANLPSPAPAIGKWEAPSPANPEVALKDRNLIEMAFQRLLQQKKALEDKVLALEKDLQRVSTLLQTSRTPIRQDRTTVKVSGRPTGPASLSLPHSVSARALALSPDGQHLAVAESAGKIRTYRLSRKKNLESWRQVVPEVFDPVQAQVRELQRRYQNLRKEIPQDSETVIWDEALTAPLQEYLERDLQVIKQRKRLDTLQKNLDAVATSRDGKVYPMVYQRLNLELDGARKELVAIHEGLQKDLRKKVLEQVEAQLPGSLGFHSKQLSALDTLIQTVNEEAQRHRDVDLSVEIREEKTFKVECKSITFLDYLSGGKFLVGCGCGPELFVWDAYTGAEVKKLRGNPSPILKFAVSPDANQVVFCGDGSIHRWKDAAREATKLSNKKLPTGLRDLAVSESGESLNLLTSDGVIQCWDMDDDGNLDLAWSTKRESAQTKALAVTPDQTLVACLIGEKNVKVYDGQSGKSIKTLSLKNGNWTCLAFISQSNVLAIGSKDGAITYFDTRTWEQQGCLRLESSPLLAISVSPGSRMIGVRHANGHASLAPLSCGTQCNEVTNYGSAAGKKMQFWFEPALERIKR